MTDSYSALESLLLFQSVAHHGASEQSFSRIAESLKSSELLQRDYLSDDHFNVRSLIDIYLNLLKNEAKSIPPPNGADKPASLLLDTVEDATPLFHLIPRIIPKLYDQYKEQVIREIKEDEEKYFQLLAEEEDKTRLASKLADHPIQKAQPLSSRPASRDKTTIDAILNDSLHENAKDLGIRRSSPIDSTPTTTSPSHAKIQGFVTSYGSSREQPSHQARLQFSPQNGLVTGPSSGSPPLLPLLSGISGPDMLQYEAPSPPRLPQPLQPHYLSQPPIDQHGRPIALQLHAAAPIPVPQGISSTYVSSQFQQQPPPTQHYPQIQVPVPNDSRRSGGIQLPPFSINQQQAFTHPSGSYRSAQCVNTKQQGALAPLQTKSIAEPQQSSTPSARDPRSLQGTQVSAYQTPFIANLLQYGNSDVHFSSGSSTGWKGPLLPEKERPRSISPVSDREGSSRKAGLKGSSRRKAAINSLHLSRETRAGKTGRRGSNTPSITRTRSHSIVSFADDMSVASNVGFTKGIKSDFNTPTPSDRFGTRSTRSRPAALPASATSSKRKCTASIPNPPIAPSDHATSELPRQPQYPPDTIVASRNFNKMTATLMDNMASGKHGSLFAAPVPARTTGYYRTILQPTDLKTIKAQIAAGARAVAAAAAAASDAGSPGTSGSTSADAGSTIVLPYSEDLQPPKAIVNAAQLEQELMRMFANAVMFNEGDDTIVADTREMLPQALTDIANWRSAKVGGYEVSDDVGSTVKRRRG